MDDMGGIVRALEQIHRALDKPFEEMHEDNRHEEMIAVQNTHHKEMLDAQNVFNTKILEEQKRLALWTKILALATIGLAVATIVLVYFSAH